MNKKFIFKRTICAALSAAIIAASLPLSVFAEEADDSPKFSSAAASSLMKDTVPAGIDKTTNPYGYDVGRAFAMVEQNELLYLETYTNHVAGKIADVGTPNDLYNFVYSKSTASNGSLPNMNFADLSNCVLIQSTSFDPDGTGRNDHAAYVGLNRKDKKVYAFVYDARSGKLCSSEVVGEMTWAFDSDGDLQIHGYDSNRYIDVVAGDFDNDGKDTLIIYVANTKKKIGRITDLDYYSANLMTGCFLKEYEYADSKLTMLNHRENGAGYYQLGDELLNDYYVDKYQNTLSNNNVFADTINGSKDDTLANHWNKLTVDMAVGDFNGDRIDDLAVLSYNSKGAWINPTPQVKIKYGKTGRNDDLAFVDSLPDEKYSIKNVTGYDSTSDEWLSVYNGGLACGDINNDGYDDLVVAGSKLYTIAGKNDAYNFLVGAARIEDTFAYGVLLSNQNDGFIQSEVKTMAANKWSEDECVTNFAVEAVAFNGANAADYIFINGSLYTYNTATGELNKVSTSGFQFDDGLGGKEEFFRSVVVGNFDGNTAGREQIIFVASCRDKDSVYSFKKGYITGVYNNDTKDDYGTATGFTTTISGWGPNNANGGYKGTGAQMVLTSCDRDQDGVIARYKGVNYAYSDPEVKAVMQAAPYFAALGDSANNETDYTITESYELEQSSSDNVSYSVGMSYSYGGLLAPVEVEISAGYCLDWSKTFSEALEKEYTMTVKAQAYNTALVLRTPVFVYCFEVLDENGNWSGDTAMTVSIPQQPVYQQLSIDDYNSFAEEYNAYMEGKGHISYDKKSGNDPEDAKYYYPLEQINKEENWLDGNEGNPFKYDQKGWGAYSAVGGEQLSQNTIRLGYAGGLNEVSYSKSNIKSVSEEISHGFYFNFSISVGVFGDGILFSHDIGFETSLSYSSGHGVSTTKTSSKGCIGAVNDLDGPALREEGIPENIYTQYTFDWTLGQWFRHLCGEKNNKTVFIGYSLSNVNAPAPTVDDLDAELTGETSVRLSWTVPDAISGWEEPDGYYVYQVVNGEYNRISDMITRSAAPAPSPSPDPGEGTIVTDEASTTVEANTTAEANTTVESGESSESGESNEESGFDEEKNEFFYNINNLKTNSTYEYVVTSISIVDGKQKESTWSNLVSVATAKKDYPVICNVDNEGAVDVVMRHLGNVIISSGDEISEGDVIKVRAVQTSRQYELVSLTLKNGDEEAIFKPKSDDSIDCVFTLAGKAVIEIKTRKKVESSVITFAGEYKSNGVLLGNVSAAVGEIPLAAPGGEVTDNVTFTAEPQSGYALRSWKITDAQGNVETVPAAGSNTYTLYIASTKYTVEAEFVSLLEIGKLVKLDIPDEGGSVDVFDSDGNLLELSDSNSVYVPENSHITFTAKPDAGCRFKAWIGAAEGQTGDSFTMTITDNVEIGVEFEVPVRVKLTYSVAVDDSLGMIASNRAYQSGDNVPVGTEIKLTAQAAENYRVEKLEVTANGSTTTIMADDKLYDSFEYALTVDAQTEVLVYFTEIEQFKVDVEVAGGNAALDIRNGADEFASGGTVRFCDEITIVAVPDENCRIADKDAWTDNGDGSYTYRSGAIKSDIKISVPVEVIPDYTITFPAQLEGCTITVKNGDVELKSGDTVPDGTKLKASAVLDKTYFIRGWYIGGELIKDSGYDIEFIVDGDTILTVIVESNKGDKGDNGEQGEKGDTGAQGEKGDNGAAGAQGEKGDTGAAGAQGEKGDKGDTGATGAQGEKGDTGAQGEKGDKGDKGDTGATGAQGEKGDKGDRGNTGATGAQGEKGDKGDTGAQGEKGDKGDKGDTGATGAQGEKGEKGDAGEDGIGIMNITIDENGSLIITLTDETVLDLGNIRGADGEPGIPGLNGKDGMGIQSAVIDDDGYLLITLTDNVVTNLGKIVAADGKDGADGRDGIDGKDGIDGRDGADGRNGADGRDGADGKDGIDGKDGADGKDGIGIKGCSIDAEGNLILTLTDNTTLNAGNLLAVSDSVNVSKPLATAAVAVSGTSLLGNIASVVVSVVRRKRLY